MQSLIIDTIRIRSQTNVGVFFEDSMGAFSSSSILCSLVLINNLFDNFSNLLLAFYYLFRFIAAAAGPVICVTIVRISLGIIVEHLTTNIDK